MSAAYDLRKYAVLYVDDEETALKYFRKAMEKDFQVLTATSADEADALLDREAERIGVIITDQRMPGRLGVEVLKRARKQWPDMVRLLITAFSEINSAIEAVNSGAIFRYITKPADLKELRVILTEAMERFLSQKERHTLLGERLSVVQRMIVADRVRSLAAMAGGISHHLRNSMTALTCFLEEAAPPAPGDAPPDPKYVQQLWTLATRERERLLDIILRVGQTAAETARPVTDELDAAEFVKQGVAAAAMTGREISVTSDAATPRLKVNAQDAVGALKTLLSYVGRLSRTTDKLTVAAAPAAVGGTPGARVRVSGGEKPWTDQDITAFFTPFAFPASDPSDLGVELLGAFSTAYRHGGDIIVNKAAPDGPGFDLLLPADPAQVRRPDIQDGLLEKLFTHFQDAAPTGKAA